ncbi:MAG: lipoyl(octanoyl) transferase LipB [Aquisalinus sp.]|nr:lipoyl(octanoyl) transferase LipB [Aquisalinus sp.]
MDAQVKNRNWLETPVQFAVSDKPVEYNAAVAFMESRAAAIHAGEAEELVWFLEHPPLYTAGTSAKEADLLMPDRFPVYKTRRGGEYTYHGPGQRVAYVMINLARRTKDVRRYVQDLERWIIAALGAFTVTGEIRDGRVGVWVDRTKPASALREDKIAAIGVRIRRWVTFHGIALNVEPDLSHFEGITPCGISEQGLGVTSLVDLGRPVTLEEADAALQSAFEPIFGPLTPIDLPDFR